MKCRYRRKHHILLSDVKRVFDKRTGKDLGVWKVRVCLNCEYQRRVKKRIQYEPGCYHSRSQGQQAVAE